ncbi:MAG: response regulator [Bacteroidales bacterium]|nr:response regulator [Bacteroidales bacterium]
MSMCQDSLGRIWLGTEDGLSIYDGNGITTCRTGFKDGLIRKLVCDSRGDVYFLTATELVRHNTRTGHMDVLREAPFSALYIQDGFAHIIQGQTIFRCEGSTLQPAGELPFDSVTDLLRTREGRLFLICPKGLYVYRNAWEQIIPTGDLYSLFESHQGEIWSGSNTEGLFRVYPDGRVVHYCVRTHGQQGFLNDNIRAVTQDAAGRIWFGSFKGLYCYDPATDRFRNWQREDREGGMSGSSIHSLMKDRDGILWAGTYYGGVNYLNTRDGEFSFYPATSATLGGLSYPVVGYMVEDSHGKVWICTEGGGLNCLDPDSGRIRWFGTGSFTNAKWLAFYPEHSRIYIATNRQGLFALNTDNGNITRIIAPGGSESPFYVINAVERYFGKLILSTDDGVWLHDIASGENTLLYPKTGDVRYVHPVLSGDRLLLASATVVEFDLRSLRKVREYSIDTADGPARPMRVFISEDGAVYCSTFGQGVFRLENGVFRHLEESPRNGYRICAAGQGRLLISSGEGILLTDLDCRPLQHYIPGKNLPLDGLVRDNGLVYSRDGIVYAGGTNGLASFHPDHKSIKIRDSLYFADHPYSTQLSLLGAQKRLDFTLSTRHNLNTKNWRDHEYRLKGRSNEWIPMTGPTVSLSEIKVGMYTLQIRSKGDQQPECSLDIMIRPHWYASIWAQMLYFALFSSLVWYVAITVLRRRKSAREAQLYETKMKLFTTVSHELRTPLTIIIAQIDSIFQTFRLGPQLQSRMGKVRSQARQVNQLVSELIDFRRIEQGMIELHVSSTPVNPFVEDIVERFRELAASKEISISFIPSPEAPRACMDAYHMQKVLMNLVFNAVKFTPRGGSIELEVCDGEKVSIHVKDTGIGIKKEDKQKVFDRFFQAEGSGDVSEGMPGSGIGLALAREIVQLHHGSLSVSDREGGGSVFTIVLSKESDIFSGDTLAVVDAAPEPSSEEMLPQLKMVIAEDNPEMLSLLKELFSVQYQVFTASDGAKALELVSTEKPDLVLSDLMMPGMGGDQLCAAIKGDARLATIPVVLLTALDDPRNKMEGLLKGADDYITKPFDSRMLLTRCNNLVRTRGLGRTSPAADALALRAADPMEKEFLEKVGRIIEENIGNPELDMDSLASMMNMSRTGFYVRFRNFTSESPAKYILSMRLQRACELLDHHGEMSIAEISDALGFSTQNYFCRRFKERYGIPPLQYRHRNSAGK